MVRNQEGLWVLDLKAMPADVRKEVYEIKHERVRASRQGWDRMGLDDWKIVRTRRGALRSQIVSSCLGRGLLWRFHIIRCAPPEAEASGPHADDVWHYVKRVG